MRRCEIQRALEVIFEFVDGVNRYLERRAPWKAAKQPGAEQQVATTLYTSCEALRCIALLIAPFLPETAAKILERLGIEGALEGANLLDDVGRWGGLRAGTPTTKGPALFPRIEPAPEKGA
jgi:methionyl-tRNA synthetase